MLLNPVHMLTGARVTIKTTGRSHGDTCGQFGVSILPHVLSDCVRSLENPEGAQTDSPGPHAGRRQHKPLHHDAAQTRWYFIILGCVLLFSFVRL